MHEPISFFVFQQHSVFMPLRFLYPECFALIDGKPQLHPMLCLRDVCHANANCMETLAKRVNYVFTELAPTGKQLFGYFKYPDRPKSIRAGWFDRELNEPKLMVLNGSAFEKFKNEGISYSWVPTNDFLFPARSSTLIPAENLLVKPNERHR